MRFFFHFLWAGYLRLLFVLATKCASEITAVCAVRWCVIVFALRFVCIFGFVLLCSGRREISFYCHTKRNCSKLIECNKYLYFFLRLRKTSTATICCLMILTGIGQTVNSVATWPRNLHCKNIFRSNFAAVKLL